MMRTEGLEARQPVVDEHHDGSEHNAETARPPHSKHAYQQPQQPWLLLAQREHGITAKSVMGRIGGRKLRTGKRGEQTRMRLRLS